MSNLLPLLLRLSDSAYLCHVCRFRRRSGGMRDAGFNGGTYFWLFSNCPISLTHYGNGCGPVYFGAGYVSQGEWWRNGFVICTMNVVIWLTIGMAWWKVIGLY